MSIGTSRLICETVSVDGSMVIMGNMVPAILISDLWERKSN